MLSEYGVDKISMRFSAILSDTQLNRLPTSVTGCLLSHLSLLNNLPDSQTAIIFEDDVRFSKSFGSDLHKIVRKIESTELDVLFLGQTVSYRDILTHAYLIKQLKQFNESENFLLLNAFSFYRFGTFAYLVNGKSVSKIKKLINDLNLEKNAKPIDSLMKDWIKKRQLKGAILMPYLVGIDTDIESTMHDRSNADDHHYYAQCINLYLKGYYPNRQKPMKNLHSQDSNEYALELCSIIYDRLTGNT